MAKLERTYSFHGILKRPAGGKLIGRREIVRELSKALDSDETAVVALTGAGGIGKSAVVYTWLTAMERRQQRPERELTWKFSDVDTEAGSNSNLFFDTARSAFSLGSVTNDNASEMEIGDALLSTFQDHSMILVLDNLEVLQQIDFGGEQNNSISNEAIKWFLIGASDRNTGHAGRLVVITSRQPLDDLKGRKGFRARGLRYLSVKLGIDLLQRLGVNGSIDELTSAVEDFGGNALALVLLAGLVKSANPDAMIGRRHEFKFFSETALSQPPGDDAEQDDLGQARKILQYYEKHLTQKGEIDLMRMMALFHRSMTSSERDYLLANAAFLTAVRDLPESQWTKVEESLTGRWLLNASDEFRNGQQIWDCHALIREHFRIMFMNENPAHWRQAHSKLFEYFVTEGATLAQATRADLVPSYRAVHHGCFARRYAEALKEYQDRIMQGDWKARGANELGAIAEDAAVLRMFFEPGSVQINAKAENQLDLSQRAWLQARTAFCLTYLGRLEEAARHRGEELTLCEKQRSEPKIDLEELDRDTAHAAGKLAELQLLLGNISEASRTSTMAVELADRGGYTDERIRTRCRKAAVAHMRGDWESAALLFGEAFGMQAGLTPTLPTLSSDHGYLRRSFILDRLGNDDPVAIEAALHDAEQALDIDGRDEKNRWLVAIGLDRLSKAAILGRQAVALHSVQKRTDARNEFDEAYKQLIASGAVVYFPEFYLVRARFHFSLDFEAEAIEDTEMALKHARDYGMSLAKTDALLILADIYVSNADRMNAEKYLNEARDIVDRVGYERRRKKIDLLQERLT